MPRYDIAPPDLVDITVDIGAVHVITGAVDRASVAVNPADPELAKDVQAADRAEVELTDGRLVIRATELRGLGKLVGARSKTGAVDIVVEVPDHVELTVSAQIATVRVDGQLGRTEIRTQVGAIHLDGTGDVTARTSGGDVTIGHAAGQAHVQGAGVIRLGTVTGPAEVKNHMGPIEIGTAEGSLRLRSSTGDVVVDAAASDVVARTSTGSITIGAAAAGTLDLRTPAGTIRVGVPEGTSVFVDATTKLGRVEQQLDAADGPATSDRRAEIQAHTGMGDIVVHRA